MPPACAACKLPATASGLLCPSCWEALAPIGAGRWGSCGRPQPHAPEAAGPWGARK
ncbi:MAG: double zinc ribbon domain-containing protein [Thermaurantiacus sp.]